MTLHAPSPLWNTRYGLAAPLPGDGPVARALQLYGEWAEHETDLLSGLVTDGHHVVEVGGDFGAHTLWLARAVGDSGSVHVIEPQRLPFQQLCANVALNQLPNVFTHHAWLGNDAGPKLTDGESIRALKLDDLDLHVLHVLKINLADALIDALASGEAIIAEHQPLIYARLSGIHTAEQEVEAIKGLGYRVWSHAPTLFNPRNHAESQRNLFPGIISSNVIAATTASGIEFDDLVEL